MKSEVISKAVREWIAECMITRDRKDFTRLCEEAEILISSGYGLAQLRFALHDELSKCQIVPMTMQER